MTQSCPLVLGWLPVLLRPQTVHLGDSISPDVVDTLMDSLPVHEIIGQLFYSHEDDAYFRVHGIEAATSDMSDGFLFTIQHENAWYDVSSIYCYYFIYLPYQWP